MRISDWSSDVCSSDLLTAQEIRHCVFHGPIVDELSKVNENAAWRKIIGKAPLDQHQKDIELILRTLAISTRAANSEKTMQEFLNVTMKQYNNDESKYAKSTLPQIP